jgi:L-rhamnono-1,4-lactonase
MSAQGTVNCDFPLIDSHIHLYAASRISSLNWTAELPAEHPLNRQCSVQEYQAATRDTPNLLGFVFLETDRKSGLGENQWQDALDEVDFLVRIARGTPQDGDGHRPEDAGLVLGIVPWAPVAAGEEALSEYVRQVRQRCGEKWNLVKGFRYLVQDKPSGVMLHQSFIEGLQWLAKSGLTFDLGIDARSGGLHQLEEACEMMGAVYAEGSQLRIIINHFCKPNLRLTADEALEGHADFTRWKDSVYKMSKHNSTYMKLSGLFSELPPQGVNAPTDISILVNRTKPWVDVVFTAFGPSRIMYGSDWPVCTVGGPGIQASWQHWRKFVGAILESQGLTAEEEARVWSRTAAEAYNIQII